MSLTTPDICDIAASLTVSVLSAILLFLPTSHLFGTAGGMVFGLLFASSYLRLTINWRPTDTRFLAGFIFATCANVIICLGLWRLGSIVIGTSGSL